MALSLDELIIKRIPLLFFFLFLHSQFLFFLVFLPLLRLIFVTMGYRTGLFVAVVIVAIIMMCLLTNITGPKRTAPASVKKKKR